MTRELQPDDPQTIGPYRLVGQLGQGGMGRVFLGVSPGGRPVAVKAIRSELAADPEFRARFGREVAAARRVSGVFTAQVVDADVDGPVVARGCLGWPVHPPAKRQPQHTGPTDGSKQCGGYMTGSDLPADGRTRDAEHAHGPSDVPSAERIIPVGRQIARRVAEHRGVLDMPSDDVYATRVWFGRSNGRLVLHLGDLDESALEE